MQRKERKNARERNVKIKQKEKKEEKRTALKK